MRIVLQATALEALLGDEYRPGRLATGRHVLAKRGAYLSCGLDLLAFLRRQTWVLEGGVKDRRLVELARGRAIHDGDGWRLQPRPQAIGLVAWNTD